MVLVILLQKELQPQSAINIVGLKIFYDIILINKKLHLIRIMYEQGGFMKRISLFIFSVIILLSFIGCQKTNAVKTTNTTSNYKAYVLKYNEKYPLNPGWENYLPLFYPSAKKNLKNKTVYEVNMILGNKPYITIKNLNTDLKDKRETRIYLIGGNKEGGDNSALYVNFAADKVIKYKIDDFSGDILEEALPTYLSY